MKKILKGLVLVLVVFIMLPLVIRADDTRIVIDHVELTSNMAIPTYGGEAKSYYTYTTIVGEPAYMTPHMGTWYKQNGSTWSRYDSPVFREGKYRWSNQVRIDDAAGTTHKLAEDTTLLVDSVEWTINNVSINPTYSMIYFDSPEYTVEADPNYELTFLASNSYNIGNNYVNHAIDPISVANGVLGGSGEYTFSKTSGPEWLIVSSDGTISGTPTQVGNNSNFIVRVTDSLDAYKEITLTVATTAMDPNDRTTISHVELTSNMEVPTYGGEVKQYYSYTTTVGEPAYMTPHMGMWYKKNGESWNVYNESTFIGGTYRFANQVRIDDAAGTTHKLAENTTLLVDGAEWTIDSVSINPTYSMIYFRSPEYEVASPSYFDVTFEPNNGSAPIIISAEANRLLPADKYPDVTKAGYNLEGWYKDIELQTRFEPEDEITKPITVYAKWVKGEDIPITNVVFKGVVTPVDGKAPSVSTITVEPSTLRIEDAFWVKDDGANTPATQFVEKERYLLFIHIEPQEGYTLNGMNEDKMTVNGTPLKAEFISERNEFVIYYEATKASVVEPEGNSTIVDPSEDPASLPVIDTSRLEQIGASTKTVKLEYNKVPEANGYFVYQKSGKKWKKVATIKNVNTTTATIKKLKAGTKYTFKVVSYVTSKKKVKKKTTTVYTPLTETDTITAITTPDKPKKPSIKATNFETEKLTFKKPKGTSRIEIYRSTSKKGTYEKVGEVNGTTFTDTGLNTGTTYYYKIRACNFNCSGFTSVVSKKLTLSTPKVKVSSPESGKVLVKPNTVAGEDGYIIQYSTKKNKGFKEVANLDVYTTEYLQEANETMALKSKKTYYYRVRAYRVVDGKVVYSSWSKVAKVKVK